MVHICPLFPTFFVLHSSPSTPCQQSHSLLLTNIRSASSRILAFRVTCFQFSHWYFSLAYLQHILLRSLISGLQIEPQHLIPSRVLQDAFCYSSHCGLGHRCTCCHWCTGTPLNSDYTVLTSSLDTGWRCHHLQQPSWSHLYCSTSYYRIFQSSRSSWQCQGVHHRYCRPWRSGRSLYSQLLQLAYLRRSIP